MENRGWLTKILAIAGTLFVLFPLLRPAVFSVIRYAQIGRWNFDYLMPAELFPMVIAGGGLLIWAAARARLRLKWLIWSLATAIGLLVLSQVLAVVTGMATSEAEPSGISWVLVLAMLAGYVLAVGALCVGGILLLRDLYFPNNQPTAKP